MADSNSGQSSHLDPHQLEQAQNILDQQMSNIPTTNTTTTMQADLGAAAGENEALKDQIDGATVTGPKRADASTGGRVMVAETGDLHDLPAARRQSQSQSEKET